MFVVLHHIWLTSWPSFPHITGPWWLGWLLYGHMAVAVFIVVSGFSLALAPMRNGGALPGGVRRFLRRRAWRILPAYWAALILSVPVTALLLSPDLGPGAAARSLGVHGLLLQDVVGSEAPNGALWSIAIEWQIYFVFPLILLVARRTSLDIAVMITALVVLARPRGRRRSAGALRQDQRAHAAVPRPVRAGRAGGVARGRRPRAASCAVRSRQWRSWPSPRSSLLAVDPGLGVDGRSVLLDGPAVRFRRRRPAGADTRGRLRPGAPRARVAHRSLARALLLQHLPHPRPDRGRPRQVRVRARWTSPRSPRSARRSPSACR